MTNEERMKLNVMQKLIKARQSFLKSVKGPSGTNIKLEYSYFELKDIVPRATQIFANVGLLGVMSLNKKTAFMKIYNVDNPDEAPIVFSAPYVEANVIVSRAGNDVTTPIQARGSTITYFRRYLWMMALDVVENDSIEENNGLNQDDEEEVKPKAKKPATTQERKEIKEELTAADDNADDLQIQGLKAACKKLMELDKEKEEFVQSIAMKTEGMTKISREACETLVKKINDMIAEYQEVEK